MDSDRYLTFQWLVSGRVQGVGYRWFVLRAAQRLGTTGWAKNLRDGQVEVVGQGTPATLDTLDRQIRTGPPMSVVENVEKTDVTCEINDLKSFEIN